MHDCRCKKEGEGTVEVSDLPRHVRAQIPVPGGMYWQTYEGPDNERDRVRHERGTPFGRLAGSPDTEMRESG